MHSKKVFAESCIHEETCVDENPSYVVLHKKILSVRLELEHEEAIVEAVADIRHRASKNRTEEGMTNTVLKEQVASKVRRDILTSSLSGEEIADFIADYDCTVVDELSNILRDALLSLEKNV